jgi:hypothetical protein
MGSHFSVYSPSGASMKACILFYRIIRKCNESLLKYLLSCETVNGILSTCSEAILQPISRDFVLIDEAVCCIRTILDLSLKNEEMYYIFPSMARYEKCCNWANVCLVELESQGFIYIVF